MNASSCIGSLFFCDGADVRGQRAHPDERGRSRLLSLVAEQSTCADLDARARAPALEVRMLIGVARTHRVLTY